MLRKECAFFRPYLRDLPATLDHPLVRQVYPAGQATRLERLWAAREALLARVEDLPHTFCHLDAIRRNLHRCEGTEGRRVVAFDWEWAESLCLGDAAAAVGRRLDAVAFTGYIDGLRDAGWRGDPAEVRFAYCAASALRYGLWGAWLVGQLAREEDGHQTVSAFFARPVGAVVNQFALLLPLLLDHADEAQAAIDTSSPG